MKRRWSLKNKKSLITGATRGIGKAIVNEFLELGAEVFIVSRNQKDIDELIKDFSSVGHKAQGMKCDVSVSKDRQALVQNLTEMWGTLDILVNNAGTNTRKKTLENTEEQYSSLIDLNLKSVFELCRMFHPLLKKIR